MRSTILAVVAATLAAAALAGGTALASSSSRSSSSASGLDKVSLTTSIQGDRFEIRGGKLALSKSRKPAVRRLARRLIKDHTKSLSDAIKLARQVGAKVEKSPSESQQWELGILRGFSGRLFNRAYASLEVKDHIQDIQETSDEVDMGSDPAVVKDAKQELPTLRKHLRLSRRALRAG